MEFIDKKISRPTQNQKIVQSKLLSSSLAVHEKKMLKK